MPARVQKAAGERSTADELRRGFEAEGMTPREWGNGPGDTYDWHAHGYHKVLYCLSGSIVFHTKDEGDLEIEAGDRLDVEPGTDHAATVGPDGVQCIEASR
ncbi:MAG: cupin domain-containing protein [Actinomycetota bacterium]|nr:cupin domain-containing protein [Actinomycetota bacterium]MDQ3679469.1 cupin domain-containing protein [Actinomycetota bacterium]